MVKDAQFSNRPPHHIATGDGILFFGIAYYQLHARSLTLGDHAAGLHEFRQLAREGHVRLTDHNALPPDQRSDLRAGGRGAGDMGVIGQKAQ